MLDWIVISEQEGKQNEAMQQFLATIFQRRAFERHPRYHLVKGTHWLGRGDYECRR